ncbi:hypothetical protein [Clostridium folliculivorans]|uniref:Uncharacterized protein n=1 Tax=Clostridium folliculivorans TaxID=2886038 RepID=A0A9W6DAM3_9CLOT|nr:hypothetical protein [Clostridium folliculivorans]GKU25111.1 hypothetical protein CFOLD11_19370 [Clostridium folliculivorans]GKU31209.1 hypothetical protein CFB3_33160 [Clostridium folliculivorans]
MEEKILNWLSNLTFPEDEKEESQCPFCIFGENTWRYCRNPIFIDLIVNKIYSINSQYFKSWLCMDCAVTEDFT